MMEKLWLLIVVLVLFLPYLGQTAEICFRGMELYTPFYGPKICLWCEPGTFMPDEEHSHEKCYSCTTIQNPLLEKLVSLCTKTHDTVIHCVDGYYRTQPSYPEDRGHCQPCSNCLFPKRPCQTHHDTVCCPGHDYTVLINKDGHAVCVRECEPGHFLNSDNDQCQACPQNTYMDERKHANQHCKNCEIPRSQKEKIVRPCNATHPTVTDCIEGYSRQFSSVDQSDHGECIKLCGRGLYLDPVTETCQTCPENTYMDEDKHSYAYSCKTCATPKSVNEKVVQPCNSTHQTVIGCVKGFYRRLSDDLTSSKCAPCRNCSENTDGNVYEGRACGELSNSVCCSDPGMTVVEALYGPVCVFLPTKGTGSPTCGEGEYLFTSASGHSVTCLPCPQGTYMDKVQHTRASCISCTEFPNRMYCDHINDIPAHQGDSEDGLAVDTVIGLIIGLVLLVIVVQIVFCALKYWWNRRTSRTRGDDDDTETRMALVQRRGLEQGEPSREGLEITGDLKSEAVISKSRQNEFISVRDFSKLYLPHQYCDDIMVDFVKKQAKLTTFIKVGCISEDRKGTILSTGNPYPYSEGKYPNLSHTGTGWVQGVQIYRDKPCLCADCKVSDKPMKEWGKVVICTATRVVFDITEGKNSQCYFFYESDLQSCPSLSGAVKVLNDVYRDWCYMTFFTHNLNLVQKLHDNITRYHRLRRDLQHKYNIFTDDSTYEGLTDRLPLLRNRFEQSLNLLEKEMEEIQKNSDKYFKQSQSDVVTKQGKIKLYDQFSCLGILPDLAITEQGKVTQSQRVINMLSILKENYTHWLEEIDLLKTQLKQKNMEAEDLYMDKYRELRGKENDLSRFRRRLMLNVRNLKDESPHTDYPQYRPRYNSNYALTIIVSHPMGRSQQISLGEVTHREKHGYDHYSIYRYTNKVCQGCEGARVFILGREGLSDYSHSRMDGQEGESGAWPYIIPYIINL